MSTVSQEKIETVFPAAVTLLVALITPKSFALKSKFISVKYFLCVILNPTCKHVSVVK